LLKFVAAASNWDREL